MRGVNLFRSPAPVVLAVSLALAACTSATPSLAPVSAPPSEAPVAASPRPTPVPARPTPTPTPTAHAGRRAGHGGRSVLPRHACEPRDDGDVRAVRARVAGCWSSRASGYMPMDSRFSAQRAKTHRRPPIALSSWARNDHAELVRYALDEGGLRGADARYPGDADDAGSVQFVLNAQFVDDDADVEVEVEPLIGGGTNDVYGNPIKDLDRREQLEAPRRRAHELRRVGLPTHGAASRPFVPSRLPRRPHRAVRR